MYGMSGFSGGLGGFGGRVSWRQPTTKQSQLHVCVARSYTLLTCSYIENLVLFCNKMSCVSIMFGTFFKERAGLRARLSLTPRAPSFCGANCGCACGLLMNGLGPRRADIGSSLSSSGMSERAPAPPLRPRLSERGVSIASCHSQRASVIHA